jgi:squalene-hopene/tetraprenyl-beta-curcumene cyclase
MMSVHFKMAVLSSCLAVGFLVAALHSETPEAVSWNKKAAAAYLDERETWWMSWPDSARDHNTFCVSCHTVVPYALARPALRSALAEHAPSVNEAKLLDNVKKRVSLWNDMAPFYSDEKVGPLKTPQSRGTESVLNALILASYESQSSQPSDVLKIAFQNMWAQQQRSGEKKGGWFWLNFHTQPWEADDSQYYGATLAAIAVGTAPKSVREPSEVQANVQLLREFLQKGYPSQDRFNRITLLWASAKFPGLLDSAQQKSIIDEILGLQQQDGGWSLSTLVGSWKRGDGTPQETKSDGYATGMITFALQQAGLSRTNTQLNNGLSWLSKNQDATKGLWPAYSLNKQRDPSAAGWLFMSDAATGYAVLALTQAD